MGILSKNAPAILTAMAIAGTVATTVAAVKATPDAVLDIKAAEKEKGEPLTTIEIVKVAWWNYIPTGILGLATVGCIIGLNSVHMRRQAILAGLYAFSERAYREYQDKAVELFGRDRDVEIRDAIAIDKVNASPLEGREVIIVEGRDILTFDEYTGRYFKSDMETLRRAANDVNLQCINHMYASQNDFYRRIGLPTIPLGDEVGWTTENPLELKITTVLSDDNRPCLAIGYRLEPKRNYYRVF